MASGDRGAIDGGGKPRAADACAHRYVESAEPERRTRVRPVAEGQALGTPEAGEGSMTARNYCEGPAALRSSTEAFMQRSGTRSNDGPRTPALGTWTHDQENNA